MGLNENFDALWSQFLLSMPQPEGGKIILSMFRMNIRDEWKLVLHINQQMLQHWLWQKGVSNQKLMKERMITKLQCFGKGKYDPSALLRSTWSSSSTCWYQLTLRERRLYTLKHFLTNFPPLDKVTTNYTLLLIQVTWTSRISINVQNGCYYRYKVKHLFQKLKMKW